MTSCGKLCWLDLEFLAMPAWAASCQVCHVNAICAGIKAAHAQVLENGMLVLEIGMQVLENGKK